MTLARTMLPPTLAAALALGTAFAVPTALAAQTAAPDTLPQAGPSVEVDDAELEAFARTALAVSELRDSYIARLSAVEGEAEQERLIEEGNLAMLTAIEEKPDMTVERFFEINAAAQADAELNERIVAILQDLAAEG